MRVSVNTKSLRFRRAAGLSLVEMVITISVMGVIASIGIASYSNVRKGSSDIIANEVMETVNLGLKKFSQNNYNITITASDSSTDDEATILGLLQQRDDTVMGSPFVMPNWAPVPSNSSEEYRIRWGGRMFEMLEPGEEGSGLMVDFQAGDYNN